MMSIPTSARACHSLQRALPLGNGAQPAACFASRKHSGDARKKDAATTQRMRPAALLDSSGGGGNGSTPGSPTRSSTHNGAGQHHSIQHPLFPDAQQAAAGPMPVQTQRGLPLFNPMIGSPPCPACSGTGKSTCGDCRRAGDTAELQGIQRGTALSSGTRFRCSRIEGTWGGT